MSEEVCPKCGLPSELCVCEEIAKEDQRIKVYVENRAYGKPMTIVKGIDSKDIDLNELSTELKTKCACGGTVKNKKIELQGDHKRKVKEMLIKKGFSEQSVVLGK
ncbi:stress response translation initiation inhibitor YciH [Methanonatronarchaeum sp. AMET-Sl]|uniref:stress response translation initiation inhibitor YciH n=1 Tax=Methanonatronarchaeum sp. AMET-Sl TaxID=3037654 RepID=UPI00244DE5B0|nr:stress response translation initiation inhibitor YciH [Methanonatronarchaeum sp. AMET-Sl]WGI17792.1 stress response translation initiation inhibitor YciH [Methanonatronarchaeum sp. AMET-Sl]